MPPASASMMPAPAFLRRVIVPILPARAVMLALLVATALAVPAIASDYWLNAILIRS